MVRPSFTCFAALAFSGSLAGCAREASTTHLFVRDPHQVWVEAESKNGEEIVLPPGEGLRSVRFLEGDVERPGLRGVVSYATLFREPSGSITLDDRICAPWPTSPLSGGGELYVPSVAGAAPYVSDGATVRIPYVCEAAEGHAHAHKRVQIDFVTPWTNVREVRIVRGEAPRGVDPSTHPALQREDWHE